MVATDLRPTDPVRWYLAYAVEREQAEQEQRSDVGGDIQMIQ